MKRLQLNQRILLLGAFLAVIIFISSCSHDDDNIQPDVAGLMAFNLAPDRPLIGISLSGRDLGGRLPYRSFTGGYLAIFPGNRFTQSYDGNTGEPLVEGQVTYDANKYYSLFVTGSGTTYKNIVVNDGLDTLTAMSEHAYVRYINAIPGSDNLTLTISKDNEDLLTDHPDFDSVSAFKAVPTGEINIDLKDGKDIHVNRTISVEERGAYTLLLIGKPGGTSIDSVQIRYVPNATLTLDSTAENKPATSM